MANDPEYSVKQIADMLAGRAESVVADLRIPGSKQGPRFMCASGFRAKGTQVSIKLTGDKAGRWKDFAKDESGDLIDLIMAVEGLGKGDAVQWAKNFLGLAGGAKKKGKAKPRPADLDLMREEQRHKDETERKAKIAKAHRIWTDTLVGEGTLVEAYLRSRGINLAAAFIPWPVALRFAPLCKRWMPNFEVLPAMIAGVQDPDGQFMTVHATWITSDTLPLGHMTRKHILELGPATPCRAAKLEPKKLVRGPYTGGSIRLTPWGRRTLTWAEGIETALSVLQVRPDWGAWSTVSVSNMANVPVPDHVDRLILLGDGDSAPQKDEQGRVVRDENGQPIIPADEALTKAARIQKAAARDRGRDLTVEIIKAPAGVDFNDLLQGKGKDDDDV